MKVGFLVNQIDNRGTGNATYDYAHYNEELLGNESYIFTFLGYGKNEKIAVDRFLTRFKWGINDVSHIPNLKLDVLYHVKSGENDGYIAPSGTRYAVHAVFNGTHKHGDRYAAISAWLGERDGIPYVNHMVNLPSVTSDLRGFFGIPPDATVFGRHGGFDTFDIPFAWSAISKALDLRPDLYFVFLNTKIGLEHPRVFYMDQTAFAEQKKMFINTCDAMIHARERGETFGIAVGEFDISGKPILTYQSSGERAHYMLSSPMMLYKDEETLIGNLLEFQGPVPEIAEWKSGYKECTPENIMKQFKEYFLD